MQVTNLLSLNTTSYATLNVRQGGLNSSIVTIPMGSNDLPFIFNESTNGYQTVSIQGQLATRLKTL